MIRRTNNLGIRVVFSEGVRSRGRIMADYKERFERWQKKATEKFDEIDGSLA